MRALLRAPARLLYRALGYYPVRIRGESFRCDPYHIGFWREVGAGRWEPETFALLEERLTPDSRVVDVGAWIGPVTLFAARRCRTVYALEPDPAAYRHLLWNLDLNGVGNVLPFQLAIGARSEVRTMWSHGARFGDSRSTLLRSDGAEHSVACARWEDWLALVHPGRLDFIKMDIEGGEFEVLPAMADYLSAERPALLLALHASMLEEGRRDSALAALFRALTPYTRCYRGSRGPVDAKTAAEIASREDCSFLFLA